MALRTVKSVGDVEFSVGRQVLNIHNSVHSLCNHRNLRTLSSIQSFYLLLTFTVHQEISDLGDQQVYNDLYRFDILSYIS
jgi:hypothetical protein